MSFTKRNFLSMRSFKTFVHRLQHIRSDSSVAHDRFFFPTTGRWLWNESQKQEEHTRKFDIEALKHVVIKVSGATPRTATVRFEKLAEGASNKVLLAIVGEQRLIVKIPDPVVPPRLTTASEVATLEFLRSELRLPVPQVFSWSDSSNNPVGCEYIIMEEAPGRPSNTVWPDLKIEEKMVVVDEILSIQKRLMAARLMFGGYGSLYLTDDASKLGFSRYLPLAATQNSRFCIGPLAHHHFVGPELIASNVDCGPWNTPQDYLISVARSSMAQIKMHTNKEKAMITHRAFSFPTDTASDVSIAALSGMLEVLCMVIPHIVPHSTDQHLPLLWHKDLHLGNIFVSSEGHVTSIIDWQDANTLPLFLGARVPQFIEVEHKSLLLELPEHFSEIPEPSKTEVWERFRQSMLMQYYLADLRENVPELAAVLDDEQLAPIRKQVEPFAQISRGQDIDALLLRETLLQIQRHWSDFVRDTNAAPRCPISIDGDELDKHQKDGRRYNEFQDLLKSRNITVAEEGWVPIDDFEKRKDDLRNVIKEVLETLETEEQRLEFKAKLCHWDLTN